MEMCPLDVCFMTLIFDLVDDNRIYSSGSGLVVVNYGDNSNVKDLLELMRDQYYFYKIQKFEEVRSYDSYNNEIKMTFDSPASADEFLEMVKSTQERFDQPLVDLANLVSSALLRQIGLELAHSYMGYSCDGLVVILSDLHDAYLYNDMNEIFKRSPWLGKVDFGNGEEIQMSFSKEYFARRFIEFLQRRIGARR